MTDMRGFTLLEVLVSITILVIIIVLVYSTFTTNISSIEIARQISASNQTARGILDRMSKEFESAYIIDENEDQDITLGLIGVNREIDGRPADTVNFTTLSGNAVNQNSIDVDLCAVGYLVQAKEEEQPTGFEDEQKTLSLFRRENNFIDDSITDGGATYEMADNIVELNILYKDANDNEFESWDTLDGEHTGILPSVITIRLVIKETTGNENVYSTSVHPMLAGNAK